MSLIEKDLASFHKGLLKAQKILDTFSDTFTGKIDDIEKQLSSMTKMTSELKCNVDSPAGRLVNKELEKWQAALSECSSAARANIRGREFQSKFEKKPMVMVFGIVKAGKSTLGNFLHGRSLVNASFDNPYKSGAIPWSKIVVDEKGREDLDTKEHFDENSVESTCSIQYFEIPGMAWVDTPGIGAVEKKDIDIRRLEDLAKQYVQYADLVVFLANSANPGINEDVDGYRTLYANGKKALAIITRSDSTDYARDKGGRIMKDSNGRIKQIPVPKDPERRKAQENALMKALSRNGIPADDCNMVNLVSISTLLADKAIESHDDELWRGSNMGEVYRKITDVISDDSILELKKQAPKKLLNSAIDKIIGTAGSNSSLTTMLDSLRNTKTELKKRYDSLNPSGELVRRIANDVVNQVRGDIRRYVDRAVDDAGSSSSVVFKLDGMQQEIQKIIVDTLNAQVRKIVGDFQTKVTGMFSVAGISATAERETETFSYTVRVPDSVERGPSGAWEHVKSWFGAKYYRTVSRTETRTESIDLGIDPTQAKAQLLKDVEDCISKYVSEELDELRNAFFKETLNKIETLDKSVSGLVEKLSGHRY